MLQGGLPKFPSQNVERFLDHLMADAAGTLRQRVRHQPPSNLLLGRVGGIEQINQYIAVKKINGAHSALLG